MLDVLFMIIFVPLWGYLTYKIFNAYRKSHTMISDGPISELNGWCINKCWHYCRYYTYNSMFDYNVFMEESSNNIGNFNYSDYSYRVWLYSIEERK